MGRDKRGVSGKFLQRELVVAYQTAWTMAHKLRHGLSEDPTRPLRGFLEADEAFIGGRGDPTSSGRSTANRDKSLVVAAVEKVPAPKNKKGKYGHAVKRQHGFFAGNARIAGLPAATGAELGAFLKANVAAQSHLLTDGFAGYRGGEAGLGEHLQHTPVVQGEAAHAGEFFPIIHTLFSNIKAWLVGTHHGVSTKHLPESEPVPRIARRSPVQAGGEPRTDRADHAAAVNRLRRSRQEFPGKADRCLSVRCGIRFSVGKPNQGDPSLIWQKTSLIRQRPRTRWPRPVSRWSP